MTETSTVDIRKAGAVILKDRHFLVTRARGKDIFVAPGGKLESGETDQDALVRELQEEVQVRVDADNLEHLSTFTALAAGDESRIVEMQVFLVNQPISDPVPSSEIEEILWVNTKTNGVAMGSIFEHDVMPLLKEKDLID